MPSEPTFPPRAPTPARCPITIRSSRSVVACQTWRTRCWCTSRPKSTRTICCWLPTIGCLPMWTGVTWRWVNSSRTAVNSFFNSLSSLSIAPLVGCWIWSDPSVFQSRILSNAPVETQRNQETRPFVLRKQHNGTTVDYLKAYLKIYDCARSWENVLLLLRTIV